jgi:phospholipid-transporting ATPase
MGTLEEGMDSQSVSDIQSQIMSARNNISLDYDGERLKTFFKFLSVCHTCVVEKNTKDRQYQASSPDELALINGAKQIGYEFIDRTDTEIYIRNNLTF